MIRIAAVGDLHLGEDSVGSFRPHLAEIADVADLFLLAGDLTQRGSPRDAEIIADELRDPPVPTIAVLGNHDYHADAHEIVVSRLEGAGVIVVEGSSTVVDVGGVRVGIAGTKGFGGGLAGASGTEFGESEMKAFVRHTRSLSEALEKALTELDTDLRLALLHYSPVRDTLVGEKPEIYPFLGSFLLAEAIDAAGADLVLHGHAHAGSEKGTTPGGIRVRNVAQPVLRRAFAVYELEVSARATLST
ncbi:MAG TPA: metallophosphoesterase [Actinomycetota bacterium]|nr:metallophosphoesterase [Actinomycetota bacterium]